MPRQRSFSASPTYLFIIFSVSFVIAIPYFIDATPIPRTEELDYSIVPLIVYARELLNGTVAYWCHAAGIGIPWPVPHSMTHVPTVLLFAFLPVFTAVGITVFLHSAVMGYYILRIADSLNYSPPYAIAFLLTLLVSAPLEYLYVSDATAAFIGWTTLPIAFFYSYDLLHGSSDRVAMFRRALALGIAISYGVINGHTGIYITYLIGLIIFIAAHGWQFVFRCRWFMLAFVITVILSSEKVLFLVSEMAYFPPTVPRLQYWLNSDLKEQLWNYFLKPFFIPTIASLHSPELLIREFVEANWVSRAITLGPIFAFVVIAESPRAASSPVKRPLVVSFWICALLMLWPLSLLPKQISATWTFRDPAIIFGAVLSAWILDERAKSNLRLYRMSPRILSLAQGLIALLAAFPHLYGSWFMSSPTTYTVGQYNSIVASYENSALFRDLAQQMAEVSSRESGDAIGRRFLVSSKVKSLMEHDKIHDLGGLNNAGIIHDMDDVSFISKGISQDAIHPSQSLPYGLITGERFSAWQYRDAVERDWTIEDQALLSLLGIQTLIAMEGEDVTANDLIPGSMLASRAGIKLVLYKNQNVLPRAFFAEEKLLDTVAPKPGCSGEHFTCMDLAPLVDSYDATKRPVFIQLRENHIELKFAVSKKNQELILTIMFRPEWVIMPRSLNIEPQSFHGIFRIAIPAGIDGISMKYDPLDRIAARTMSSCTLLIVCGILVILQLTKRTGK